MNLPTSQFCVLPWISLEASPIGTVRPCCLADDEIRDSNGHKFNLQTARFADIQNSPDTQTLRGQFLAGQRPETCRKCWSEEDSGRASKRMHTLDRLKHMLNNETQWDLAAKPLMFLDLKLGNICNLKCRICGSWSSSTFATEELQTLPADQRKTSFHYQMLQDGAWPRSSTQFWSELADNLHHIRYLEFTGGEPLMIQEHFDLLQSLIDAGVAAQIEIHYNTNATQAPTPAAQEIWSHFGHVEIAFSIDDVGPRFEYQRTGAEWTQAQRTIELFRSLRGQRRNMSLQVCSTVNVFNVWHLAELACWIDTQQFDFVYWNIMHDAPEFSIANLAPAVKARVRDRLSQAQVSKLHQQEFARMIEFMAQGTSDLSGSMLARMQVLDQRRGQNLAQITPEWAEIIGYA